MYIRRFTYKPEDVDCKLCTEYKKCDRNLMKCPWIPSMMIVLPTEDTIALACFSQTRLMRKRCKEKKGAKLKSSTMRL